MAKAQQKQKNRRNTRTMRLIIDSLELSIDWGSNFNESVYALKKSNEISIACSFYLKEGEDCRKLDIVKSIQSIPSSIYVAKASDYFWVFGGCKLISKSIKKTDPTFFPSEKWIVEISFSYEEVFGTNKADAVKREIALSKIFSRD